MDLAPEELEFRREVLSFLEEHLSADVRRASRLSTGVFVDPPWSKEWHQALFRKGWITHAWPREYGGCGWSPMQRYIYERSEEPTSELQSLMRISTAVFCFKKKTTKKQNRFNT